MAIIEMTTIGSTYDAAVDSLAREFKRFLNRDVRLVVVGVEPEDWVDEASYADGFTRQVTCWRVTAKGYIDEDTFYTGDREK